MPQLRMDRHLRTVPAWGRPQGPAGCHAAERHPHGHRKRQPRRSASTTSTRFSSRSASSSSARPWSDQIANLIIAQLLYLDREDPDKEISLYINSPGGVITAGLAIYDTMRLIRADVSTICVGMAASMATVLLCAGTKGEALRPAQLHHPHAPAHGRRPGPGGGHRNPGAGDPAAAGQDPCHSSPRARTGPTSRWPGDSDRDFYLTPEQAVEYGLIDEVLVRPTDDGETSS